MVFQRRGTSRRGGLKQPPGVGDDEDQFKLVRFESQPDDPNSGVDRIADRPQLPQSPRADGDTSADAISENSQKGDTDALRFVDNALQFQHVGYPGNQEQRLSPADSNDPTGTESSVCPVVSRVRNDSTNDLPSEREVSEPYDTTPKGPVVEKVHMAKRPHDPGDSDDPDEHVVVTKRPKVDIPIRSAQKTDISTEIQYLTTRIQDCSQEIKRLMDKRAISQDQSAVDSLTMTISIYETTKKGLIGQRSALIEQDPRSVGNQTIFVLLYIWALHHLVIYMTHCEAHHYATHKLTSLLLSFKDIVLIDKLGRINESYTGNMTERLQERKPTLKLPDKENIVSAEKLRSIVQNIFEQLRESLKVIRDSCSGSRPLSSDPDVTIQSIVQFSASLDDDFIMSLQRLILDSIGSDNEAKWQDRCSLSKNGWDVRVERIVSLSANYLHLGRVLGFEAEQWDGFLEMLRNTHNNMTLV